MNDHINFAILHLETAINKLENGYVKCDQCGNDEPLKNLEAIEYLTMAKDELLKVPE